MNLNWKIFSLKYDQQEPAAFEKMSYLLFCAELNNRIGLFRYKNQTGIETEPIEKEGVLYGFQAKYYTTAIAKNKEQIIDSLKKAKRENDHLNVLLFYLNQEFSESRVKGQKKPKYQLEIEAAAKKIGLDIIWRVPSHFELQLSLPENKYLYNIFFNLDRTEGELIEDVFRHNGNILQAIQTEINFSNSKIKIDRSLIVEKVAGSIRKKKNIIISGEGGCGKTSIIKEFYNLNSAKMPIAIFKAKELNVSNINDIFCFNSRFTFDQFLNAYKDEPVKLFVIDSAEKLAEITDNSSLILLIRKLREDSWNIIFTTRYAYHNDLIFHIKENHQLPYDYIDISLITKEELTSLSQNHGFSLPKSKKFLERLRNLFYLNEYINKYQSIDASSSLEGFIDLLWKKRIQDNIHQENNLHLLREKCILHIARQRCQTGQFYINGDELPQQALFYLKLDEILGYDDNHNGYFITHDIYEEWALDKIISRCFFNHQTTKQFFDDLGDTLPIRRAFRMWLSSNLLENSEEIEAFIKEAFVDEGVSKFWKDELLISVLLSDYSAKFFDFFEQEMIANNFAVLKRILFLLRIACTDIFISQNIERTKPKGKGWEEVIAFIYEQELVFIEKNLKLILPVLKDWSDLNAKGKTTRYAGLIALRMIEKMRNNSFNQDKTLEDLLVVIFNASHELKEELEEIFNRVISSQQIDPRSPYHDLYMTVLEKPYLATQLIGALPSHVIQLCNLFWKKRPEIQPTEGFYLPVAEDDSTESYYGLVDEYTFSYFPASANQTPVQWLLYRAFGETLDFIIDFTNRAVQSYKQSPFGKEDVVKITLHVEGRDIIQYLSPALWEMYRGTGSPVVPNILQSIHMALERVLLDFSKRSRPETVKAILLKILTKSESTSLTAIVSSIVLAHPNKFYEVALILFNTLDLFHVDSMRSRNESQARSLQSIGYGLNKVIDILYADERLETCKQKHRNSNLESLLFNYQFSGIEGFDEKQNSVFIEKLYSIIDGHKSIHSTSEKYGIFLARVDRRNLVPKVLEHNENSLKVEFEINDLSKELREKSEQYHEYHNKLNAFTYLKVWSDFLASSDIENEKLLEYDKNPSLALLETKNLLKELDLEQDRRGMFDFSTPAFSCSKLIIKYRDQLSQEDKDFCREVIISSVSQLFSNQYRYQISDGVEASIHAIPSLIEEYPHEAEDYVVFLVLALLDQTSLGQYKRICDYVIESIQRSKLWERQANVAQSVLFGYIKLKPLYKDIVKKKRGNWGRIPKSHILEELDKVAPEDFLLETQFNIDDINLLDAYDLEVVYQLIPANTEDKIHLEIYSKSLPIIIPPLLKNETNKSDVYLVRQHIFERFSHFILCRKKSEINTYLKPFVNSFVPTEETASFLGELVSAEDKLHSYEQFWYIWNSLYPKIKELCKHSHHHYLDKIIINYLLAWRWWREDAKEWSSLKNSNLSLYSKASREIGAVPSVLYSIIRVLNSIGIRFEKEGVEWIYNITLANPSLNLKNLESETFYYLERFLKKFIFSNRQKIKEQAKLKNKIITVLSFMIERGSIQAYLLRESIL